MFVVIGNNYVNQIILLFDHSVSVLHKWLNISDAEKDNKVRKDEIRKRPLPVLKALTLRMKKFVKYQLRPTIAEYVYYIIETLNNLLLYSLKKITLFSSF